MLGFLLIFGTWALSLIVLDLNHRSKLNEYKNKIMKYERMLYLKVFTEENEAI